MLSLKQRDRSVSDHVIEFRILAVEAGWPDKALRGVFYQSLKGSIKDHLCSQPEALSFEDLVSVALRSDVRLKERQAERNRHTRKQPPHTTHKSTRSPPPPSLLESSRHIPEEPMQIGHSKLTMEERQKRREEGSSFYCGNHGHLVAKCPLCYLR